MSAVALAPKLFTFGSDDAVEAVVSRIADSPEEYPVWGTLNARDAWVLREAALCAEVTSFEPRDLREGSFSLEGEQSAQLFEALCDYALGETSCDIDADRHDVAASVQGSCPCGDCAACDCDRRCRAWSWASGIAEVFGVEMI